MHLKGIEINGFKSFADKVKLEFNPGITCIVGPNGCGKSNVVDSLRWCIGEMSRKSLRSKSMADIIFNGTAKRSPLNMCEVSMVFDNETRRLPIDFSEVTVSRKLFRSGESEYFLNKVQCRLRDVRDLFLDTGIGGEGYAIIDQGGVEFVLSATPEERRELFEEAAGVSKYKAKRDEAQRKLEKVEQDLARLMDSVVMIEEQIKKLDSEARKAKLYQKYREELKSCEIAMMLEEIEKHSSQIDEAIAKLQPLQGQIGDKSNTVSALEGEISALNLNLTHKQAELNQFNERISSAKYQIGLLEGNITNCDNLSGELQNQIQNLAQENENSKKRLEQIQPSLNSLKSQLEEMDTKIAPLQSQYEQKVSDYNNVENEIKSLQQNQESTNANLMAKTQREMELSNRIALQKSGITHDSESLINLEKEIQKTQTQLQELNSEIESLKNNYQQQISRIETVKSELSSLENQKTEKTNRKKELTARHSESTSSIAALNATMEVIKSQGSKDPYWVGASLILDSQISGVKTTLRKLVEFDSSDRIFFEEAFGKFLDSIICENMESAENAIRLLKENGNARCRLIILSEVPNVENPQFENVKGKLRYPAELENLMRAILSNCSLDSKRVSGKFWIIDGAQNVESPEPYWGKEEEVNQKLSDATNTEREISRQIKDIEEEISSLETQVVQKQSLLNEEQVKTNTLKNSLESKEQNLGVFNETMELIGREKEKLSAQKLEKEQTLSQTNEEVEGVRRELETLREELVKIKTTKEEKQSSIAQLREGVNALNSQLFELRIKRGNLEADLKATENEYNAISSSYRKREEQIAQSKQRIETLGQEKLSAQAQLSSQRDSLAELETGENKLRSELTDIKTEYDEKSKVVNGHKKELSEMEITAHDLQNSLNNHKARKEEIVAQLQESWETTPEEAKMKFGDVQVDHDRVKMMRKRLENMGPINMTAPEEYDTLSARDEFLKTQIGDLEQAKNDLKAAIHKINATTRENFKHTFDQVREHFQKIYQSLFEGGEADLRLTQPENLLDTGVEIFAQPPGKKLQSISVLSGGEKALTALALLFSFFCVNPSPFCLMDEADAPLDEANVERFVNLLKEFTKTTQFIVITHNKRTMESGDMLYGVTMEESGVSKTVSVLLNELENKTPNPKKEELTAVQN
jgi:chromosome segregation protein